MAGASKACPQCAEVVRAAAQVCRFCRYEFPANKMEPTGAEPKTKTCPRCAEDANADASVCPFCRYEFQGLAPREGALGGNQVQRPSGEQQDSNDLKPAIKDSGAATLPNLGTGVTPVRRGIRSLVLSEARYTLLLGLMLSLGSFILFSALNLPLPTGRPGSLVETVLSYAFSAGIVLVVVAAPVKAFIFNRFPALSPAPARLVLRDRTWLVLGVVIAVAVGSTAAQLTPLRIPLLLLAASVLGVSGGVAVATIFLIAGSLTGWVLTSVFIVPGGGGLLGFFLAIAVVGRLAERNWTKSVWQSSLMMLIGIAIVRCGQLLGMSPSSALEFLLSGSIQAVVVTLLGVIPFAVSHRGYVARTQPLAPQGAGAEETRP